MSKERNEAETIMVWVEERRTTAKDILGRMNARIEELGGASVWEDSDLEEEDKQEGAEAGEEAEDEAENGGEGAEAGEEAEAEAENGADDGEEEVTMEEAEAAAGED